MDFGLISANLSLKVGEKKKLDEKKIITSDLILTANDKSFVDKRYSFMSTRLVDCPQLFFWKNNNKLIYEKKNISISIQNSIPNALNIYNYFISKKLKASIGYDKKSTYFISNSDQIIPQNFVPIDSSDDVIFSDIPKYDMILIFSTNFFLESRVINLSPFHFRLIFHILMYIFITIHIVRRFAKYHPAFFQNLVNLDLWIVKSDGSFVTFPISQHKTIINQEFIYGLIQSKRKNTVCKYTYLQNKTLLYHVHVYPFCNQYYLAVFWIEEYNEQMKCFDPKAHSEYITGNCADTEKTEAYVLDDIDNYPYVKIDLRIDDLPCTIELKHNESNLLPFGSYPLNLSYLTKIHQRILKEGIVLNSPHKDLPDFIDSVYERLDFDAVCLFKVSNYKFSIIYGKYSCERLKTGIFNFVRKVENNRNGKLSNAACLEFFEEFKLCSNRFSDLSDDYVLICALKICNFVIRPFECRFHFILKLVFSFRHSLTALQKEFSTLESFCNILETSGRFALLHCIDNPTNLVYSHGNVLGLPVTQERISSFVQKSTDRLYPGLYEEREQKTYSQVIMMHTSAEKNEMNCLSISSTIYCDESCNSTSYLYLIEDVTFLHARAIKLKAEHEKIQIIEDFIKIYRVMSDLSISDNQSLSKELGYQKSVNNLSEILYSDDTNFMETQKNFRLICAYNYPLWFRMLPIPDQKSFYIFNMWKVNTMLQIALKDSSLHRHRPDSSKTFLYLIIRADDDLPISMLRNWSGPNDPPAMYAHFLAILHPSDSDLYMKYYQLVKSGEEKDIQLLLRVWRNGCYEWFLVFLNNTNDKSHIKLYMFNCNKQVNERQLVYSENRRLDSAFISAKMMSWIFEDSSQPERAFSSLPCGTNFLIFNWTTVDKNVVQVYQEPVRKELKKQIEERGKIDLLIPMKFERNIKWILFRGSFTEFQEYLTGVAVDVTNMVDFWFESDKSECEILSDENLASKLTDAKIITKRCIKCIETMMDNVVNLKNSSNREIDSYYHKLSDYRSQLIEASI